MISVLLPNILRFAKQFLALIYLSGATAASEHLHSFSLRPPHCDVLLFTSNITKFLSKPHRVFKVVEDFLDYNPTLNYVCCFLSVCSCCRLLLGLSRISAVMHKPNKWTHTHTHDTARRWVRAERFRRSSWYRWKRQDADCDFSIASHECFWCGCCSPLQLNV